MEIITVITDPKEIEKLHNIFLNQINKFSTDKIYCGVGYPSGSFKDNVSYSKELNIWLSVQKHHNKYWNGFGIGKPIENKNNSLKGEINFPYSGINRRIAGVFAKNDYNQYYVLHRGKIGGGRKGRGKNFFLNNFRGDFINAIDENYTSPFCLVGELNSKHFPEQVANFIKEINRVKYLKLEDSAENFKNLGDFKYSKEKSGSSITENNEPRTIDRTHGIVVNKLADELIKKGYKVANDKNRDLFIHINDKIKKLFEIKTNSGTQCLYTGLGQLLIYSIPIKNDVDKYLVVPDQLEKEVTERLNSLGVEVVYYKWIKDKEVEFSGLDDI